MLISTPKVGNTKPIYMVVLASVVEENFDVKRAQCN